MGIQFLKKTLYLLSVVAPLLLFSCTYVKKTDQDHLSKQRSQVERTIAQSEHYFNIGDYGRAIDAYRFSFANYPGNHKLLSNYLKKLENIKHVADRSFEKRDYTLAGRTYFTLLRRYGFFKQFAQLLSFDSDLLNARVMECRTNVSGEGFAQYRKGNIREAIAIWNNLLAFDPDDAYIRNAVDTATIQLRTLEGEK